MARQIIILDTRKLLGVGTELSVAFWYPVPAGQEIPFGSSTQFRLATQAERDAVAAGQVVEEVIVAPIPAGTTQAQIKTKLIAEYTKRLADFQTRPNPNQFYGLAWDGTTWA